MKPTVAKPGLLSRETEYDFGSRGLIGGSADGSIHPSLGKEAESQGL